MNRVGVVVMAYGTPRDSTQVEAYYTDIRRGRPPTVEQLKDLVDRYDAIGGISPLGERTETQRAALAAALEAKAPGRFAVVLGQKHASPFIEDAIAGLAKEGITKAVGLVLAPHYSALSVGQYLERATTAGGEHGVDVAGIESWHLEPAYIEFLARTVRAHLDALPPNTKVLFTAHSLPQRILESGDPYPDQVRATAAAVAARLGLREWSQWSVAWQSAGRTPEPWIGPDILAVLRDLAGSEGADGILVCACGFVADHLEVLYDLDIEAARLAAQLGLTFARAACVNDDPDVIEALATRVLERAG